MTLLDRIVRLANDGAKLAERNAERKQAEEIDKKANQLVELANKSDLLIQRLTALAAAGRSTEGIPGREKLRTLLSQFHEARSGGGSANREFAALAKHAQKWTEAAEQSHSNALAALTEELRKRWRDRARLEELASLDDRKAAVDRALRQLERLQNVATWRQAAPSELGGLVAERAKLIEELDRLDGDGVPPSVLTFLKAARSGGARYSMMTQDVIEYLEASGKMDQIRVSML